VARLKKENVTGISQNISGYDAQLVRKTGLSLKEIAIRSTRKAFRDGPDDVFSRKVAVIPVTVGKGVIEGFVEAVVGILAYVGADVFRTDSSDVAGLAEGVESKADIIFLADDSQFIALNLQEKRVIYNVVATARGYVTALEAMAGGVNSKQVLVLGAAGRVGWNAVLTLRERGAQVRAFDPDQSKIGMLIKNHVSVINEPDLEEALKRNTLLFDASPLADNIRIRHVKAETMIASPSTPLMLDPDVYSMVEERLIHDSLEIGVASMYIEACVSHNDYEGG